MRDQIVRVVRLVWDSLDDVFEQNLCQIIRQGIRHSGEWFEQIQKGLSFEAVLLDLSLTCENQFAKDIH